MLIDGLLTATVVRRADEIVARSGRDHYVVILNRAGCAEMMSGSRMVVFEPGDVYIAGVSKAGLFRHDINVTGPGALTLTLVLPRSLLAPLLAAPDTVQDVMLSHKGAFGRLVADGMLALRRQVSDLGDGESRVAVVSMAHLVAGALALAASAAPVVAPSARAAQAAAIKGHIDQNLGSARLEIDDLCRTFRLSRAALYRLFESESGLAGYIQQRRLNRAFAMLISPAYRGWRLIDFALDARFSSDATFIRAFRRMFGMTPGEARVQVEQARTGVTASESRTG